MTSSSLSCQPYSPCAHSNKDPNRCVWCIQHGQVRKCDKPLTPLVLLPHKTTPRKRQDASFAAHHTTPHALHTHLVLLVQLHQRLDQRFVCHVNGLVEAGLPGGDVGNLDGRTHCHHERSTVCRRIARGWWVMVRWSWVRCGASMAKCVRLSHCCEPVPMSPYHYSGPHTLYQSRCNKQPHHDTLDSLAGHECAPAALGVAHSHPRTARQTLQPVGRNPTAGSGGNMSMRRWHARTDNGGSEQRNSHSAGGFCDNSCEASLYDRSRSRVQHKIPPHTMLAQFTAASYKQRAAHLNSFELPKWYTGTTGVPVETAMRTKPLRSRICLLHGLHEI